MNFNLKINPELKMKSDIMFKAFFARKENEEFINVEIQSRDNHNIEKRTTFYASKKITEQLGGGEDYRELKTIIIIAILDYSFNELPKALQEEKINSESLENETIIPIVFDNSDKDNENEQALNEDEVSYGENANTVENNQTTNNNETDEMPNNQDVSQNVETNQEQQPSEKTSPQDSKEKILSFEEMYKELFGKEPSGCFLPP